MKNVLAAAAVSLCFAFAGRAAELHSVSMPPARAPGCIPHDVVRVSNTQADQAAVGCAQFLATSRVVQPRHLQRT